MGNRNRTTDAAPRHIKRSRAMRILTGLQPSGILHIGNYFGAIKPVLDLQGSGEVFLFLADLHALTSLTDANALRENVRTAAVDLLA